MELIKTNNGIIYFDVVYNGQLIERFDRKYEAVAFIKASMNILGGK